MQVIGIDPGKTTGIVSVRPEGADLVIAFAGAMDSLAATRWLEGTLRDLDEGPDPRVALVERFIIAPRTPTYTRGGAAEALYTIGAVRHIANQFRVPLTLQAASTAKNAVTDAYLREVGLIKAVRHDHERDALRHALLYVRTHGLWEAR